MQALLRALGDGGVAYVLVGAAALNLHGIIRATEDIDLFVRADDDNIERLRSALRRLWDDPEIERITAADLSGSYPVIRYGPPGEDFVIDLISQLGTAIRFEDLEAQTISIEGVPVPVATPSTLYRMKSGTLRPIDQADAAVLKEKFDLGGE
jgi:hypothetical protein